ncbi:A/G-specific adenine glycosylase [Rubripirellula amarantea]|uniref:Adenine DNA glycosylase n=2 Tax=Rubripirellula amarantea TaxID=2527999 RepID=A0A5C5WUV3_9BACT|nr:A/G-specific adenine glycosylase [Rubripirellula amarantea]
MLQQTQVATVLPYFERFLNTFPNVQTLAAAPEQQLMSHWEGLGYYRRARSIHAAAKKIVADHNGEFPTDFDDVIALPGIGRYTAGAILSISGDAKHPVLEGNTVRVFSRWVALRSPPADTVANKLLWQIAESMLPAKKGAGTFNQAAMELGALICTPKTPACDRCPVQKHCAAHRLGLEESIPGKVTKTKYEDRTEFAFVIESPAKRGRPIQYLMRPLPPGVRWSGLWDFPRTIDRSIDDVAEAAGEVSLDLGCTLCAGAKLTQIKHAVTKYRIELRVHQATFEIDGQKPSRPWRFVTLDEMAELPMSVTGRKIAKILAKQHPLFS